MPNIPNFGMQYNNTLIRTETAMKILLLAVGNINKYCT